MFNPPLDPHANIGPIFYFLNCSRRKITSRHGMGFVGGDILPPLERIFPPVEEHSSRLIYFSALKAAI